MKKIHTVLIVLLLMGCLAACAPAASAPPAAQAGEDAGEDRKPVVGFVFQNANAGAYQTKCYQEAQEYAEQIGAELILLDPGNDPSRQITMMEDLIEQQVDVLMVWPIDKNAVQLKVKEAYDAGIPVVVNSQLSDEAMEMVAAYAGENQEGIGFDLGQAVVDHYKDSDQEAVNVVQISLTSGTLVSQLRSKGFMDAIAADPRIVVLEDHFCEGSREVATQIMEGYLQKYGDDIDVAYLMGDAQGVGALNAIRDAGKVGEIVTLGIGYSIESRERVINGELTYDIATSAIDLARMLLDAAMKVYKGELSEKYNYMPKYVVTQANYEQMPYVPTW